MMTHQYVYSEHKPVPVHTTARLQRYSLILASYNYKLEFRSTKFHVDCMSRVPMTTTFDRPLVNLNCNFFSTRAVTNINQTL